MKFCKDCRWFEKEPLMSETRSKCMKPHQQDFSVSGVSGKIISKTRYCNDERRGEYYGLCGPEAKYFEPRKTFIERLKEWFK